MSGKQLGAVFLLLLITAAATPKLIATFKAGSDFKTAEERIANVVTTNRATLNFDDLPYLTKIPQSVHEIEELLSVYASTKRLTDISALGKLPHLKALYIDDTRIQDLTPLAGIRTLETLSIGETWVFDLEPLEKLPRLHWLQMHKTAVKSICPLKNIRKLDWLNVHSSYAEDGSQKCYQELQNRVKDLEGGNAFKANYIPGTLYKLKVSLERLLQWLEWR